jgi:hypothetical protein
MHAGSAPTFVVSRRALFRPPPFVSPEGCRTLAGDNIPGQCPPKTPRPEGALECLTQHVIGKLMQVKARYCRLMQAIPGKKFLFFKQQRALASYHLFCKIGQGPLSRVNRRQAPSSGVKGLPGKKDSLKFLCATAKSIPFSAQYLTQYATPSTVYPRHAGRIPAKIRPTQGNLSQKFYAIFHQTASVAAPATTCTEEQHGSYVDKSHLPIPLFGRSVSVNAAAVILFWGSGVCIWIITI